MHLLFFKMQTARYENNCKNNPEFQEHIDFSHWCYNETWIIFNKEMMDIVTKDMKYYRYFKNAFVYDENYPIYLFTMKHKLDLFKNIQTTYVNWQDHYC